MTSKKFVVLLNKPTSLPLPLVTPPALRSPMLLFPKSSHSTSLSCSAVNPGYFDILPPLSTPRFTPGALLFDGLDYNFPTPNTPSITILISASSSSLSSEPSSEDQFAPGSPLNSSSSLSSLEGGHDSWASASGCVYMDESVDGVKPTLIGCGTITTRSMSAALATTPASAPKKVSGGPTPRIGKTASCLSSPGSTNSGGGVEKKVNGAEKRERNRLAAEKYRQKGRDTISFLAQRTEELERENSLLKAALTKHGLTV